MGLIYARRVLQERIEKPWRVEYSYDGETWKDGTGHPNLDAAIQHAVKYRNHDRRFTYVATYRVRHWLSRNYILADIL